MSDPILQERGRELGYEGIDFYLAGRAGVLGQVDAGVAVAALCFFSPDVVVPAWERTDALLPRREAGAAFASCASIWADQHLVPGVDWERLALLASRMHSAASVAAAPLFAGWASLPIPEDPRRAAVHFCNGLREHRMARHAAAVIAEGLDVADAVRYRSPRLAQVFGWSGDIADYSTVATQWSAAQARTDTVVGSVYRALDDAERLEFERLVLAAAQSIR